jgi:hypothetical protein
MILFIPCASLVFIHLHTYRIARRSDAARIRGQGGEVQPEVQPEEPEEEGTIAELPECPEHQPSTFLKGKPRSIISLLLYKST